MRRRTAFVLLASLLGVGLLRAASVAPLAPDAEPLRSAFAAADGKVRAIVLVSPTCGECLRGVTLIEKEWLATVPTDDLAVFVVWSDQLGGTREFAEKATELIPDRRVRQFWDGERTIGRAFQDLQLGEDTVHLSSEAWDFYLLFAPEARWTDAGPPAPDWWEHQIKDALPERRLDPQRFGAKAARLGSRS